MPAALLFIFGIFIGSFLNVVIYRLPRNESIVFPPSHCPHCRHHLAWYDLVPIFSYLMLRGACRYCHSPIAVQYPIVELLTGIVFAAAFLLINPFSVVYLLYILLIASILIVIFFTDYKYGIIPLYCVLLGIVAALAYLLYSVPLQHIFSYIFSAVGAFTFFFLLFAITKGRGMGFGDVMLVILLGLVLGFPGIVTALYLSFLTGAFVSLILIIRRDKKLKHDTIPFGPFLVTGTIITLFWGQELLDGVMKLLL